MHDTSIHSLLLLTLVVTALFVANLSRCLSSADRIPFLQVALHPQPRFSANGTVSPNATKDVRKQRQFNVRDDTTAAAGSSFTKSEPDPLNGARFVRLNGVLVAYLAQNNRANSSVSIVAYVTYRERICATSREKLQSDVSMPETGQFVWLVFSYSLGMRRVLRRWIRYKMLSRL